VRNDRDNGTLIDFLQRRQNLSLGAVRQVLRPWIGRSATAPWFPELEPTSPDRMRVESEYRRMDNAQRYPYLEQERCLPAVVLSSPRFAGRVRIDRRGNSVFPHFDAVGLCGYEIKNRGFTGFAAGGEKGLWFSHTRPDDRRLILAESAIDALSHAALFPDAEDRTRYASLGGKPNSKQPGLVQVTIAKLPDGSEIVAAFDSDDAGRMLVEVVRRAVANVVSRTGRADLIFQIHLPAQEGEDWNQVLQRTAAARASPDRASRFDRE
jgi:ribosomal protein S28E/S33